MSKQMHSLEGPPARAGRVALTLRIEPNLHRELRTAAFQQDTTIQELILRALRRDGYKAARPGD
jgi:predicted HicB family RNase H-like nuclease